MEKELLDSLIGTHGDFHISEAKLHNGNRYRIIAHQQDHCYHVTLMKEENVYLLETNMRKDALFLHKQNRRKLLNEIEHVMSQHPKLRLLVTTGVTTFKKRILIKK